jgi:hypothetical protein
MPNKSRVLLPFRSLGLKTGPRPSEGTRAASNAHTCRMRVLIASASDFFLLQQRLYCLPLGFIKCGFEQASIARDVEPTDQGLHRLVMLRRHGLFLSPDCRQMQENRHPDGFRSTSWIGCHVAIRIAARSRSICALANSGSSRNMGGARTMS